MEPNSVGRHREGEKSSSIGYAVYPRWLDKNNLKSIHIDIYNNIESKVLLKNGGVTMCPFLTALHNTENNHHCYWKPRVHA
ncbi:hypothetical protein ACTXT7_002565 [Hymenolepis weldensis]